MHASLWVAPLATEWFSRSRRGASRPSEAGRASVVSADMGAIALARAADPKIRKEHLRALGLSPGT
jgi:hypothetical protein